MLTHMMHRLSFALCLFGLLLGVTAMAQSKKLNIVFIGNSITQGAGLAHPQQDAPPVKATDWLKQAMPGAVINYTNQGVSGSTTVDSSLPPIVYSTTL